VSQPEPFTLETSEQKLTIGNGVKVESCQIYLILVAISLVRLYIPYFTPKRKQTKTAFLKWFAKIGTLIKILATLSTLPIS
jgi:hypothetical protein